MMSPPTAPSPDAADLEKTAELPLLAHGGLAASRAQQELGSTDTWIMPQPAEVRSLESRLAAESARAAAMEAELERVRDERNAALRHAATLEGELSETRRALESARAQAGELTGRLAAQPPEIHSTAPSLEARLAERDRALESAEQRLAELQQQLCAHLEALHTAEGRRTVLDALLRGLQSEVSQRDTRVAQLEAQIRAKDSLLDTLSEQSSRLQAEGGPDAGAGAVRQQLVRLDTVEEAVHVLGRKTRIGRTADNDVRVGAKFVSRHHALVLVGPQQTIIEDLNSTNGVLVNGQRTGRRRLEDGDTIALGEARFRFVVRRMV
jgi:FHA domain